MDNLHLHVIAVVLYFNLPGSVGTKSQRILPATHHHSECQWDGQFLLNCSFTRISTIPEDISQTTVTADLSYNNIKTFVCSDGRNEEWMLKHLNLSNNLLSELTLTTCTNLPILETLNLNGNAIHTLTLDMPTPAQGSKKYSIVDRLLPALKVLSVERNNLNTVPRGLGLLQSLQTVHMSSNAIQQIGPKDFQNCSQLKDIDLRNNKITKIHPDVFRDLNKLQVLDLRENALTIPLPQILVSLNFFQLEVYLSKNAWIFNCRLNAFKHLFHFVFDTTRKKWSLSYSKSASNSQKPLLYLSSFHLNCRDKVLLKRATVPKGNTSVLTCNLDNIRGNGITWWTPKGRISKNHSLPHMTLDKMNNLVIHDAEKTAEGLYLCLFNATKEKYLLYNTEVKEGVSAFLVRKARDINTGFRQEETQPNFALAVSLSVVITFVCAFCLGAFARPYLERLWRYMRRNKNSGSEQTYSNQAFSDETLSREPSASKPTNTQRNTLLCDKNFLRNTEIFPTETSTVYQNFTGSGVHSPNPKAEYQKKSSTEINMKKIPAFPKVRTNTDNNESTNIYDTGLFFVKTDYQNSNEITPNRKVRNNSGLLRSEITKATPASPERKGTVPHNEPMHTRKFRQGMQSCEELGLNGNENLPSDVVHFISPRSSRRDTDIENLSIYEIIENSPLTKHYCKRIHSDEKDVSADIFGDSSSAEGTPFTMSDCSSLADFELEQPDVSDNLPVYQSSLDETNTDSGTEKFATPPESPTITAELQQIWKNQEENSAYFETTINYGSDTTMRETASPYSDKRIGHKSVSDPDTVSSSSQEIPDTFDYFTNVESTAQNSISDSIHSQSTDFSNTVLKLKHFPTRDTEKTSEEDELQLSPLPREPQHSLGFSHTEQKEKAPAESREEEAPAESREENAPVESREENAPAESREENAPAESREENAPAESREENAPAESREENAPVESREENAPAESREENAPVESREENAPAESREENAPVESTDEDIARNSPEKNHGEADITLRRNMSTPEDNGFIFVPIDTGLNEVVKKTSLLHSSKESSLQLLPEHTAEKHFMSVTQQDDLLPQGKQARADKMQGGSDENSDGFTELQDTSNCSLPDEMQSCNPTGVLLHLHSSGKTQSEFTTDDHFQLDQSDDEDGYSFSIPHGFFNESTPYSSCSFPQKPTGNTISESTDSSKMKDHTTLTELENHSDTTVEHLQNSTENLSQKSQTNSGQDQFFVKKKRAFDGFVNILQSRRTNFNS
ncbi:leucine-rich repeat-containing protein 66 [Chamaea fasciata]|uniref:leucine-rich repeat-containing protein 66 n=1 Tax=Chamaea fasciata TaxID=190680 RepID=UPI00336AE9BE